MYQRTFSRVIRVELGLWGERYRGSLMNGWSVVDRRSVMDRRSVVDRRDILARVGIMAKRDLRYQWGGRYQRSLVEWARVSVARPGVGAATAQAEQQYESDQQRRADRTS